jgi:hypothetical protein
MSQSPVNSGAAFYPELPTLYRVRARWRCKRHPAGRRWCPSPLLIQGRRSIQNFRRYIALGLAGGAKGTPLADVVSQSPVNSGAAFYPELPTLYRVRARRRCKRHPAGRWCSLQVFRRQVSRPGAAGVVSGWCRVHQVSPGVPLGRCHVQVSQVSSPRPGGRQVAGVVSRWCSKHQVSSRQSGVPLGRCRVQVLQVSSPGGAVSTRCPPGSQVFR